MYIQPHFFGEESIPTSITPANSRQIEGNTLTRQEQAIATMHFSTTSNFIGHVEKRTTKLNSTPGLLTGFPKNLGNEIP